MGGRTDQPVLSRQIRALENELHARLFVRDSSGTQLTLAGVQRWTTRRYCWPVPTPPGATSPGIDPIRIITSTGDFLTRYMVRIPTIIDVPARSN